MTARPRKLTDDEKSLKRREFYRIVKERLDSRLERGEAYTSTKDLYKGYESLHDEGFAKTQFIAASVAQVLNRAEYRDRLFYARHVVTRRAERVGPGKSAPYKIYLRPDAVPPKDHVLVPISARPSEVGEYIAIARGVKDATAHVTQEHPEEQLVEAPVAATSPRPIDYEHVTEQLVKIVSAQTALINDLVPLVGMVAEPTEASEDEPAEEESASEF